MKHFEIKPIENLGNRQIKIEALRLSVQAFTG